MFDLLSFEQLLSTNLIHSHFVSFTLQQAASEASDDEASGKISAVAQKFPAIRYSPEETEELLQQAYAALPVRDGKRGTRNLRRQET